MRQEHPFLYIFRLTLSTDKKATLIIVYEVLYVQLLTGCLILCTAIVMIRCNLSSNCLVDCEQSDSNTLSNGNVIRQNRAHRNAYYQIGILTLSTR